MTFDELLRLIYPVSEKPDFTSLDDLVIVLAAAAKYDMDSVIAVLRSRLVSSNLLDAQSALRVYAIADRFNLEEERRIAARRTFELNLLDAAPSDDLQHLSFDAYRRLTRLHHKRKAALLEALENARVPRCGYCSGTGNGILDFRTRAKAEIARAPPFPAVFSREFLKESIEKCGSCASFMMIKGGFLDDLESKFSAAPDIL